PNGGVSWGYLRRSRPRRRSGAPVQLASWRSACGDIGSQPREAAMIFTRSRGITADFEKVGGAACGRQEFITPYTPEQNGVVERFFRSLKEECVWQHSFPSFTEARRAVRRWIRWYNEERPHQALGYLSPREFRARQLQRVA